MSSLTLTGPEVAVLIEAVDNQLEANRNAIDQAHGEGDEGSAAQWRQEVELLESVRLRLSPSG